MTIHQTGDVDPFSCRVAVYWNLSRHMWSIKTDERVGDTPKGRVIAYADAESFYLTGCEFFVHRGMHQTALAGTGARGTKRNVVAWVTGKLADGPQVLPGYAERVTFHWNDARSTFHSVDTGAPVTGAAVAEFRTRAVEGGKAGKVYAGGLW